MQATPARQTQDCLRANEWSGVGGQSGLAAQCALQHCGRVLSGEGGEGGEQLRRGVYRDERHRRLTAELIDLWLSAAFLQPAPSAQGETQLVLSWVGGKGPRGCVWCKLEQQRRSAKSGGQ